MIGVLKRIFFENWFRKIISLFVAIIIWFVVHDSFDTRQSSSSSLTQAEETALSYAP